MLIGISEALTAGDFWELILFLGRVVGSCAALYGFFLSRKLGAGDIKLMAVCVGILGVWDGICVIFGGCLLVLCEAFFRGYFSYFSCIGKVSVRGQEVRLAPYLFGGYCLWYLWQRVCPAV